MQLSIVHKVSFLSVVLVLCTAGVVGMLFKTSGEQIMLDHALEDITEGIEDHGLQFRLQLEKQIGDTTFMLDIPPIQGLLRAEKNNGFDELGNSTSEQWIQRMQYLFKNMLEARPNYTQIRFISSEGKEVVNVVRSDDKTVTIADEKLQNKSHREYVVEVLKLPVGGVYTSEINLNREYGEIVTPHQPVWRTAMPVYDEQDRTVAGLVIINADISRVLKYAAKKNVTEERSFYITNDSGEYLVHPDSDKTFGFDMGKQYRVQEDFPVVADFYVPGHQDNDFLLLPEQSRAKDALVFKRIYFDQIHKERFIAILITQPVEVIIADQEQVLTEALRWSIVLIIAGVFIALILSIRISKPIKQMSEVVENYNFNSNVRLNLPVRKKDEIGVLARSFKKMIGKVEDAQSSLKDINQNLESIVVVRTKELKSSETRQRTILESIVDGIITIDEKGIVWDFNPAAEDIFGYKSAEVTGKNINMLMPEPYAHEHDEYLKNYMTTGYAKIIGIGREVEGRRKDGSTFPLDLAVSEMYLDGKRLFSGIVRDITERKRVDKMKNEFISTVSHELRTPLTSIRGSLGLIAGGAVGELPAQAKDLLNIASNNTERLLLLINDILDIQKIESGKLAFSFQTIDLMDLIDQAITDYAAYGEEFDVSFVVTHRIEDISLYADKDRLMQVMGNLMSNAAKFSPKGEQVEISVAKSNDHLIRISVTDHGSGIPEEFKDKLFERFTQSDSSDTRKMGGTGLGLSITKAIIEKHGGNIEFVTQQGVGTTFYVELPEFEQDSIQMQKQPATERLSSVLIVEDDHDIAALIRRMLAEAGFNSDIAYSVKQARELLNERGDKYKVVTLDILMSEEGGMSFFDELRKDAATYDLPVVVVSAVANDAKRELNGGAIGVMDWLQKPIDQNRLVKVVGQALGANKQARILHVEDEQDVHQIVSAMLKGKCELVWTTSVAESREKLEAEHFDLVLLDIGLPDGSGLDLLETIERNVCPPRVVIFSAHDVSAEIAGKVSAVLVKSKTKNKDLLGVITGAMKAD